MSSSKNTVPILERITDLLGQMNLDEKLAQLYSFWIFDLLDGENKLSTGKLGELLSNGIGQITRPGGGSTLEPMGIARTINAIQQYLLKETRLRIPAIFHDECCSGFMALGGTAFPQMIGLASTFRPELAERMTTEIRKQMRAVGTHQGLAPVLDVARDPRWGRVEETFGEDPTLVSQFGLGYVRGLQGDGLNAGGVMATGKHFIGHSSSQAGQNCAPAHLGRRDLWDFIMPPFQAAIRDAGLHTIMNSYPELDGEVVAASRAILTDLLRNQLGFTGLIVSDYDAILMLHNYHRVAADKSSAAVLALNAGIQVELPGASCYREALKEAVQAGRIEIELVDAAVTAHLQKKIELGLFDNPFVDEGAVMDVFETSAQRALAKEIASQSLVLLKNDGTLPFKKNLRKLAVIGPNAAEWRNMLGDYSYAAMLEYMQSIAPADSPLAKVDQRQLEAHAVDIPTVVASVRAAMPQTEVLFAPGCAVTSDDRSGFDEAVKITNQADATILVLGDRSGLVPFCSTGETRDSVDLRLPGVQNELALAVLATGKPVVVVLINGRPLAIPEIAERAGAILEAWLPGEEGGPAIAAALLGEFNPGGKLSITFPRHVGQVPVYYNQKPSGGKSYWYQDYVTVDASPLFPFGHGLSYTRFDYSDLRLSCNECKAGDTVDVSVTIRNSGSLSGEEVVQLYVCDDYACVPRPVKELKGFTRVSVRPGQSRSITFHLPVDQLAFYDQDMNLVVESGSIRLMLGSSSEDIRCESVIYIVGALKSQIARRVFVCPVEIN